MASALRAGLRRATRHRGQARPHRRQRQDRSEADHGAREIVSKAPHAESSFRVGHDQTRCAFRGMITPACAAPSCPRPCTHPSRRSGHQEDGAASRFMDRRSRISREGRAGRRARRPAGPRRSSCRPMDSALAARRKATAISPSPTIADALPRDAGEPGVHREPPRLPYPAHADPSDEQLRAGEWRAGDHRYSVGIPDARNRTETPELATTKGGGPNEQAKKPGRSKRRRSAGRVGPARTGPAETLPGETTSPSSGDERGADLGRAPADGRRRACGLADGHSVGEEAVVVAWRRLDAGHRRLLARPVRPAGAGRPGADVGEILEEAVTPIGGGSSVTSPGTRSAADPDPDCYDIPWSGQPAR